MRNAIERAWWTEVEPDEVESELAWLREEVYGGTWGYLPRGGIPRRRVTAFERWRDGPEPTWHILSPSPRVPSAHPRRKPARPGLVSATRTSRRVRGCAGGTDLPGGGAISQHARFSCVEFWMFPSIPGNFRGSRRSRYLARGSPFRHGLNPPPVPPRPLSRSLAQLEAWIRYIGIDLNAAMSMPRFVEDRLHPLRSARPTPLQAWSWFCGSRYFAGRLPRARLAGGGPELGEDIAHLVAFGRDAAFELGPQISSRPCFSRRRSPRPGRCRAAR